MNRSFNKYVLDIKLEEGKIPLYRQLSNEICQLIEDGVLERDERLPR